MHSFTLQECDVADKSHDNYCRESGEKPSPDGYQQWHRRNPGTPSLGALQKWATWSFVYVEALRAFASHCRESELEETEDNYKAWRRQGKHETAPSAKKLRQVFRSWDKARSFDLSV